MAVSGPRRVSAAIMAFAAPAAIAGAVGRGWAASADHAGFRAVLERRCPAGTTVARAVSVLAEPGVVYPLLAAAGAARRDGWRGACLPCLAVASGAAARRRLSRVIARQRPPAEAWLIEPEGFSLPSKHTTVAALAAGACVRALGGRGPPRGQRRPWPLPPSAPAACIWACTGRRTWSRAGCSPRDGCA